MIKRQEMSTPVDFTDRESLIKCTTTSLSSKVSLPPTQPVLIFSINHRNCLNVPR